MLRRRTIPRLCLTLTWLVSLWGPWAVDSATAADPAPSRKPQRLQQVTARLERLERQVKELEAALAKSAGPSAKPPTQKADRRYEMLAAGDRVVILDTQTGETQIIEPVSGRSLQHVEVGRAWVVVTVLGNVSERAETIAKPAE